MKLIGRPIAYTVTDLIVKVSLDAVNRSFFLICGLPALIVRRKKWCDASAVFQDAEVQNDIFAISVEAACSFPIVPDSGPSINGFLRQT